MDIYHHITRGEKEKLFEILISFRRGMIDGYVNLEKSGICQNISYDHSILKFDRAYCYMKEMMDDWPIGSHFDSFPVKGSRKQNPVTCYHKSRDNNTMYKGRNLRLRIDLLNYMINRLNRELELV